MKHITQKDLGGLSRFYRANLVNCLTGIKPALLIGTKSMAGVSNLALFSSVVHLGAEPALIAFVQRPLTDFSHTYHNIIDTGYYTINHCTSDQAASAHYTSAKFPSDVSEFVEGGFKEEYSDGFCAPYVAESPVKWGMKFIREILLPENNTRMMIGEVQEILLRKDVLMEDGNLDLDIAGSLGVVGLESYASIKTVGRFEYAKAGTYPVSRLSGI